MTIKKTKVPTWFWIVAGIALIWNFMGVAAFIQQMAMTNEVTQALPDAERALHGQYPLWTKIAFACAVFGGLLGSIGLLMKKQWTKSLFVISLIGVIIQMGHSLFIAKATEVYGPGAAIMPGMVVLIAILLLWFSKFSIRKGWL